MSNDFVSNNTFTVAMKKLVERVDLVTSNVDKQGKMLGEPISDITTKLDSLNVPIMEKMDALSMSINAPIIEKMDALSTTAIKLREKDGFYGIMTYTNKFKGSMSKKGSNKIYSK